MKHKFLVCGTLGWCMEIIWTSLDTLRKRDFKLTGHSSLWMFPIYGMAACICPLSKKMQNRGVPLLLRGALYTLGIFTTEYWTGYLLKRHGLCPWDYSDSPANINGLIRLDYAPVWFATGLFYEKVLSK